MNFDKLPHWLRAVLATSGGLGIFLAGFLDSSVLSLPVINDLLVVQLSILSPSHMPYYAVMATLGSLAGCILLYFLARKGGQVMLRKHAGARTQRVRDWMKRNAFLSVFVPAILPPPMPFKAFVVAAGVFQVPLRVFVLAVVLSRSLRYFVEGILAVRYGAAVGRYLVENKLEFTLIIVALAAASYLVTRILFRSSRSA